MSLTERIDREFEAHIAGLIDGEYLRNQEIAIWVELLTMAEDHKTPVKQARFYGFTFINRISDIRDTINYLIYS